LWISFDELESSSFVIETAVTDVSGLEIDYCLFKNKQKHRAQKNVPKKTRSDKNKMALSVLKLTT
jgi:hypothetical protein